MYSFSWDGTIELSGAPAGIVIIALLVIFSYAFVYLPIKLLIITWAHTSNRVERAKRLEAEPAINWYEPPENLTPAEIGFLFDTKYELEEVFATILYLQQKKLVELETSKGKVVVKRVKVLSSDADAFENDFMLKFAKYSDQQLTIKNLEKLMDETYPGLNTYLINQGYLRSYTDQVVRSSGRIFSIMVLLYTFFPLLFFKPNTTEGWSDFIMYFIFSWPVYLVVAILLYSKYQNIAGEPWLATNKLKEIWSDLEGYKTYIQVVEADRVKYETQHVREITKNKAAPYAVALGFDTGWKKQIS